MDASINPSKNILAAMLLYSAVFAASLTACQSGKVVTTSPPEAKSDEQRILSPDVPASDMAALVAGEQLFAADMAALLGAKALPRIVFSPLSIFEAMTMVYAGARGETADQLAAGLHLDLPPDRLFPAIDALDLALSSRGETATNNDGHPFQLTMVNALWSQMGYDIEQDFLDTLALYFGAGVHFVDYAHDPEGARRQINDWVAHQTEQRIKDLIPEDLLSPTTKLVLTNAIYFTAAWEYPFKQKDTGPADFTKLDGTRITVQMMRQITQFAHVRLNNLDAVELPHDGGEESMIIILPDQGQFETVEANLANAMPRILQGLQMKLVALSLPKFHFMTSTNLEIYLNKLGITDIFDPSTADFSGITGSDTLFVTAVIHKAFISVDETSTEAGGATGVVFGADAGIPLQPDVTVIVDRPFLFVIRDIPTGAFLFMGSVRDPSAQN